jgi:GAF domain-containing protein
MTETTLARVLTDFAGHLVDDYDAVDMLDDLVGGVTDILSITGAGVSLVGDDVMKFVIAASEQAGALERVQEGTQSGPGVDAHLSGFVVRIADLADVRELWPTLTQRASEVGAVAVAGIPMSLPGARLGALTLYDDVRRDWSDEDVGVAKLLADVATGYLANASRFAQARKTAEQLQGALDSRVIIEQAKGVLAGERQISVDVAFGILRGHARSHNASLRHVAEAVVNHGFRP